MPVDGSMASAAGQRVWPCISDVNVRSKVWLEVRGEFAIGQGGVELLSAVSRFGSLARAARHVGWSYRHAWGYVRRAELVLRVPLLAIKNGKGAARGARLTPAGHRLVGWFSQVAEQPEQNKSR
jgi:molybdate transport system regulatory protein